MNIGPTVSSKTSSFKFDANYFKPDDVIIQLEQLILQTTLGHDDNNTNLGISDPGLREPAWKNSRLQSLPPSHQTATINEHDELLHLDYKLHSHVTRIAESLVGLASPTGDSEGNVMKNMDSCIEQVRMGLKHICAILCRTNDETVLWREMLKCFYEGILSGMKQAKKMIRNRKSPQNKAYVFNNHK
jgi:hypothetical protein